MATIADLVVNISANIAEFRSEMKEAADSVTELSETVKKAGEAIGEYLALKEVIRFTKEAVAATLEWSREVEDLSERMGLTAQAASALTASAREQGIEVSTLEGYMSRLMQRVATSPKVFATLGIAIRDSSGALLPAQQIMENTANRLEQFQAGANRAAAGAYVLGRSAGDFVANLERVRDTFDQVNLERNAELLKALGLEMDENGIKKSREWGAALADLHIDFLGLENVIGKLLLPVIEAFNKALTAVIESSAFQSSISAVKQTFIDLATAVERDVEIWRRYRLAIDDAVTALGIFITVATGGIGSVVGLGLAVAGATDSLYALRDSMSDTVKPGDMAGGWKDAGDSAQSLGEKAAKAAPGMEQFTAAMAKHKAASGGVSEADKYEKLRLSLEQQVNAQQLLNDAATKGVAATREANVEIQTQKDLLTLYNEKTHQAVTETSAQGQVVHKLVQEYEDLKASTAAGIEITDLSAQVADAQKMAAAQAQGAIAANQAASAIRAEQEIRRLGIDAGSDEAAQIRDKQAALDDATRAGTAAKELETLTRQVSETEQLTAAYGQGTRAAKELDAEFTIQNKLLELGIPLTSETAKQYEALALQYAKDKDALDQAQKAAEEHDQMIKTLSQDFVGFGANIVNAFSAGKQSSKSFKDQVLSDFQTLLKQLEDELLKTLVFDRLQKALDALFTGATGAGAAAGAVPGTPGGGAGGLAGAGGGTAGGTGGGMSLSSLASFGGTIVSKLAGLFTGGATIGGAGAASVGAGAAAGTSSVAATAASSGAFTDLFADAAGFQHGGIVGLSHDAVPIIAHKGEQIIPANQVGRTAMTVHQEFNIQTPDASSFRAAQSHIIADAWRSTSLAARRS